MSQNSPVTFKDLFILKLRTIYDVEQQLLSALGKMAEAANNPNLKQGFQDHLKQTQGHVARLEQIFDSFGIKPQPEQSDAIRGIISDTQWCIDNVKDVNVLDAALISAGQAAEHYEMASYGTAATWAETIGLTDIKNILHQTLEEEEKSDQVLSVAADTVNVLAYNETMDTEDEESKGFFGVGKMQAGNI